MDDPRDEEWNHSESMLGVFLIVLIGGAAIVHLLIGLFDLGTAAVTGLFAALPMIAVFYAVTSSERE